MAAHDFGTDDPLVQKQWRNVVDHEIRNKTCMMELAGEGDGNCIKLMDDLQKEAGDRIRFGLNKITSQDGHVDGATIEGNEGTLEYEYDDIELRELSFSKRWKGRISSQRVAFDRRNDAKSNLSDIWAERIEEILVYHASGYTPANYMGEEQVEYTGFNTVVAPDETHVLRPNSRANDESLVSGDGFSLAEVDKALTYMKMARRHDGSRLFRPAYKGKYVCMISPYQTFQLRSDTSTGQWLDINKSILMGGKVEKNPLLTGGLGEYNGMIFVENPFCTNGVDSGDDSLALDNVRRAFILGENALALCYGRESGDLERYMWDEEKFNYKKETGIAASAIFGASRIRFGTSANTKKDNASFVISSFSPRP